MHLYSSVNGHLGYFYTLAVVHSAAMNMSMIGSFILLELSWRSCLCIIEINPLSVASFAIIFSQSEGCLFTLLIVSFDLEGAGGEGGGRGDRDGEDM